ncbi:protein EXECUTER 1, chloroplastic [Nymphaea colorata]|nr:protein EXECUTER 1, chloroplastic [Nymphaea colorata]
MASVSLPHLSYAPIDHASHNPSHLLLRVAPPSPSPRNFLSPPHQKRLCAASRLSGFPSCRCAGRTNDQPLDSSSSGGEFGWHLSDKQLRDIAGKVADPFVQAARSAGKRFQDYLNSYRGGTEKAEEVAVPELEEEVQWDWDRWKRHFAEVEEQERMVSVLKAQLRDAVQREDYDEAAKLKVAIAAAATNDTVGKVVSHFNRAVKEERYEDAAFIRDEAGAGLLGWWFGISENSSDPYGRIIHITAAHGRYLAKSYSSRQLATASPGIPLFEIYVTVNTKGEYLQQAVYLKKNRDNGLDFPAMPSKSMDDGDIDLTINSAEEKEIKSAESQEEGDDVENKDDNDIDVTEGLTGVLNILRDMIPGAKIKVLKVVAPGKVDKDLISKVFEQIIEEEDEEEKDMELTPAGSSDEVNMESGQDESQSAGSNDSAEDENQIAVKLVIGGLVRKLSTSKPSAPTRMPAKLERRNRLSFLFHIEKDESEQEIGASVGKSVKRPARRRIGLVTSDFAKVLARGDKVPGKVLKDVGDFINFALSQFHNRQALSGSTVFHRIEIPTTRDPLNGLYVGAHGPYSSEVIHLRRRFGQWREDGEDPKSQNLEFYEYVEALKITGDPYVPAGQVAFRAKVGKHNQLPHKGIIPEEFGVVARYKGQGRLAEPGFRNPRWVDGELVILDGKYIKAGPVVGFVYWAPEYHFLVFFNRLRLED